MAEYIMCQTNSLNEEGEPIVYPRMKLCGMCDMKQFAESIENGTTFTAAEVKGLLDTISSKLAYWMSNGYSVKLDGIGVFTPALGFKKGKSAETSDKERMNAQSLQVKGINFRADTSWYRGQTVVANWNVRTRNREGHPVSIRRKSVWLWQKTIWRSIPSCRLPIIAG